MYVAKLRSKRIYRSSYRSMRYSMRGSVIDDDNFIFQIFDIALVMSSKAIKRARQFSRHVVTDDNNRQLHVPPSYVPWRSQFAIEQNAPPLGRESPKQRLSVEMPILEFSRCLENPVAQEGLNRMLVRIQVVPRDCIALHEVIRLECHVVIAELKVEKSEYLFQMGLRVQTKKLKPVEQNPVPVRRQGISVAPCIAQESVLAVGEFLFDPLTWVFPAA